MVGKNSRKYIALIIFVLLAAVIMPFFCFNTTVLAAHGSSNYQYLPEEEHQAGSDPSGNAPQPESFVEDPPQNKGARVYTANLNWYIQNTLATDFYIGTAEELLGLAQIVNNGTDDFSGKTIYITNKIDLAGVDWQPIGSKAAPFSGTINGQGMPVCSLVLPQYAIYQGLFGYVKNAKIFDLILEGASLNTNNRNSERCGTLAAVAENSVFINCSSLNININTENSLVAGLIGFAYSCDIEDCTVSGSITSKYSAGGIVGEMYFSANKKSNSIKNCINNANVSGNNYTGGVVGNMRNMRNATNTLENCLNTGNISGKDYTGGIAGNFKGGEINACINKGAVVGASFVGGIVGNILGIIKNSYTSGSVTGQGDILGSVNLGSTGGVAGKLDSGTLEYCYSTAPVHGAKNVGGIVGEATSDYGQASIENIVAINLMVSSDEAETAGRVCGDFPESDFTASEIYAWADMKVNSTYVADSEQNGQGTDLNMFKEQTMWQGGFTVSPWEYSGAGACPTLETVAMPQNVKLPLHLRNHINNEISSIVIKDTLQLASAVVFVETPAQQIPQIEIYYKDVILRQAIDYMLRTDKITGKTATCTIEGVGDYMGTITGEFMVPSIKETPIEIPDDIVQPPVPVPVPAPAQGDPPKTGDETNPRFFVWLMVLSALGMLAVMLSNKRRNHADTFNEKSSKS